MSDRTKDQQYRDVEAEILAVVAREPDAIARMSTVAPLLIGAFPSLSWCGFYRVDPSKVDELIVGPYQGPLGCLRIAFGRGVCGQAAARRETLVVKDVHAFPDHIACDVASMSEIVVPVFGPDGALIAVLDLDSREPANFDQQDALHLRRIIDRVFPSD